MARDDIPSGREIDSMLQHLEKRIETLKKRYERYFLGIDRRPPEQMRKQVVREVFELEQTFINNTAQKFKLRSLSQSFNTHKTRWNRIMRQIEEGTYKRDINRAQRRQKQREREEKREQQGAYELNMDDDFIEDLQEVELEEIIHQPREPLPGGSNQPHPAHHPGQASLSAAEKERIKQQKLAEIQSKLGLGAAPQPGPTAKPAPPQQPTNRKAKLDAIRRQLESSEPLSQPSPPPQRSQPQPKPQLSARERKLQKLRRKLKKDDDS